MNPHGVSISYEPGVNVCNKCRQTVPCQWSKVSNDNAVELTIKICTMCTKSKG